jgi:hypothetical protein
MKVVEPLQAACSFSVAVGITYSCNSDHVSIQVT